MKVIDMHCDTLYELNKHKSYHLLNAPLQLNIEKMNEVDYLLQNFAIFTDLKVDHPIPHYHDLLDIYYKELEINHDLLHPIYSYSDIEEGLQNHKIMTLLTIEEGDIINDDLSMLDQLYHDGVRMITLTWNYPNKIGYPNIDGKYKDIGLTEFGKKYIKKCEELGIIIDVSHASDQVFYDVLHLTSKPFVASHSNSRTICENYRNMSDEMIIELDKRGGVLGINYFKEFISNDHKSTIENIIKHIDYVKSIASINVIGLGSDFDGIDDDLELKDASMIQLLYDALVSHGYSNEDIEKIFYKNVLRVYKEVLK